MGTSNVDPAQPGQASSPPQAKAKTSRLTGFPKGWTIFMIVYTAAAAASMLSHGFSRNVALLVLFFCGMAVGCVIMLKGRASGFWILLASAILAKLMTGRTIGNYTVSSAGALVLVLLTWLFTRKQIDYRFWKHGAAAQQDAGQQETDKENETGS